MTTTNPTPPKSKWRTPIFLGVAFVAGVLIMAGIALLLINIQTRKDEAKVSPSQIVQISNTELDPAVWGQNFPRQYDTFKKTKDDTISTPFGGSVPWDKFERFPVLKRLWAGYAFSASFNEERGHYWALIDQKETPRQTFVKQPGACANCHAAEAPQLIQKMGWETFNRTPYTEISPTLHLGTSCADCHTPNTMELRITRPGFINAMSYRGIDVTKATRQEMRTYVCAQCHVEYYFKGEDKVLTFPWEKGLSIDNIDDYYTEIGFKDWANKETGAPMIKIQHPEFEMYSSGLHAKSGVSCSDCHMPYVREGSIKVSDHWLRSPLTNVNNACQSCHKGDEAMLKERIVTIQERTARSLRETETALADAMDAIKAAKAAGATEEQMKNAYTLIRKSQMRWDFVFSENSTGFHSPQESARVLADAINFARQAQIEAIRLTPQAASK